MNFIESILPNAASIPDEFLEATIETLYMTLWTAGLGFVLGLGLGVWLVLTQPKGLSQRSRLRCLRQVCEYFPVYSIRYYDCLTS